MYGLKIIERKGVLLAGSREVAMMVEKEHNILLRDIRTYCEYLGQGDFAQSDFFIESMCTNSQNKEMPCYLCTKKGCDMIANKLTGKKGILFTATYIDRFYSMERILLQKQLPEWHNSRRLSKLTRKAETDVLKQLVEYARQQGSAHSEKLYTVYNFLANRQAGISQRDNADITALSSLSYIENIIFHCIRDGMRQGMYYKAIYTMCQKCLAAFKEIAYLHSAV